MQDEAILTPKEAADIIGVTQQRITALCRSGQLAHKVIGKYRFPFRFSVMAYKNSPTRLKYAPRSGKTLPRYLRKEV